MGFPLQSRFVAVLVIAVTIAGAKKLAAGCDALLVTDSVNDFSGVQGERGWYYGFYDGDSLNPFTPDDFEEFAVFSEERWSRTGVLGRPGHYWTSISRDAAHPNGVNEDLNGTDREENWAVRRWVSTVAGQLRINGQLADTNVGPSDRDNGVTIRVFADGDLIATHVVSRGAAFRFYAEVEAEVGTVIDFSVDPRDADERFDGTRFTVRVSVLLEDSTLIAASVGDFSDEQGHRGWWYGFYDGDPPSPFSPDDFEVLTSFSPRRWTRTSRTGGPSHYWTAVSREAAHPNGLAPDLNGTIRETNWAVRRWRSSVAGAVRISCYVEDLDSGDSSSDNGIVARVLLDREEILTHHLSRGEATCLQVDLRVDLDSILDFVVDPNNSNDQFDSTAFSIRIHELRTFRRGDVDVDGEILLTDGIFLLRFLFLGGMPPACLDAADTNDSATAVPGDSGIDVSDAVFLLNWLFLGFQAPLPPGPTQCGPDPTADNIDCNEFETCV